jgi:DNA-binding response OmpR family regulator/two-component sensor histidine kinase
MTRSVIILLVEDDPSMLDGMSDLLQVMDIGYEVSILTASDGLKALEVMSEQTPDLIVSDIMMPKVDGFQFLQEVRKNLSWAHIPFIFLTAKGEKQEVYQGRVSGADLYITKPFNSSELLELIKTQLDRAFQLRLTHQQNMDNLKKGILQILNHEFRTPLTYVTAYYDMLADSVNKFTDGLNFQEYLRGIQAGCIRLNRLVEDFIQVIELRTGEARAAYEQRAQPINDLDTLLREAIEAKQEQADRRNVHIHYHVESNLPPVFGDRRSLLEIFHRLLDNAIKFTYAHHIHKDGDGNVFISTAVKANKIHISIKDEGIGFPNRIQDKIFELFFQHNRGLLEQQGAGTGLTIAEGLVKLHRGRIEVEGQQDVGSQFTIVLPVFEDSTSQTKLPLSQDDGGRKEATVLIVEDDRHLLEGLQELLEIFDGKYRLNVLTAPNGEAGLEVLRKCQSDLIISDIMMPYMDGYTFLEQVRQNPDWLHIPFIFLTAKGERQDIHRGWRSGVEEYVTKPYDSDTLLGLVVKQLDRYFQMQGIHAQNFDALKRSILNLITPDFRLPLSSVPEYSPKSSIELDDAYTDE